MRGVSAAGVLAGTRDKVHAPDERIAWELAYGRGVRKGDWKAIFLPKAVQTISPDIPINRWLLFNVARDPGETTELSAAEPEKLQASISIYRALRKVLWPLSRSNLVANGSGTFITCPRGFFLFS